MVQHTSDNKESESNAHNTNSTSFVHFHLYSILTGGRGLGPRVSWWDEVCIVCLRHDRSVPPDFIYHRRQHNSFLLLICECAKSISAASCFQSVNGHFNLSSLSGMMRHFCSCYGCGHLQRFRDAQAILPSSHLPDHVQNQHPRAWQPGIRGMCSYSMFVCA